MSSMASEGYVSFWAAPADMASRPAAPSGPSSSPESPTCTRMRDRVLREVLWFATEVPGKYTKRYRSVAAWELQRKSKRVAEWVGLVSHEHVWTRATCRMQLLSAQDAESIEAVINLLQGCVVTRAEHERLKPFDTTHEGRARYIAADVAVIDTSTGTRADLSALQTALD
jgi:hypothetical protein